MKIIMTFLGIKKPGSNVKPKLIVKIRSTSYPSVQITRDEWFNEFKVSSLYGKHAVYF